MNINENQNSLIEKFLDKKLSSIQQEAFEKELENEDFRKQLLVQAQVIDAHQSNEKELMVNQLNAMAKGYKKEPSKKRNLTILISIIALCLSFYAITFFLKPDPKGQALYADYFIELPADVNQRGGSNNQSEIYQTAMQSYIAGDYKTALEQLESIKDPGPKTELYKASCLMQTGKSQEAKSILSQLSTSSDIALKENAQWYLSLIYVQENNFDQAKKSLQTILQKEEHLFYNKAKSLIEAID